MSLEKEHKNEHFVNIVANDEKGERVVVGQALFNSAQGTIRGELTNELFADQLQGYIKKDISVLSRPAFKSEDEEDYVSEGEKVLDAMISEATIPVANTIDLSGATIKNLSISYAQYPTDPNPNNQENN